MKSSIPEKIYFAAAIIKALGSFLFALLFFFFACASIYSTAKGIQYAHNLADKPVWLKILGF